HPPLAKQVIALSIHAFGDNPLGWRYPGTLFGALAIVAIYLCGLALFESQAPALAAAAIAFFNQMLFVMARTAMLDIFALTLGLYVRLSQEPSASVLRLVGARLRLRSRLQMERPVSACDLHRHRRGDPPDAGLAHGVCRSQGNRLVPARLLAGFQGAPLRALL